MFGPVGDERVLQYTAATCSVTLPDQNGDPVDAVGAVTVDVARADGTTVATGLVGTHGETGVYTVTLTAAQTALLDYLTLSWKDSGTLRATTHVEVAGAVYFSENEARQREPSVSKLDGPTIRKFRRIAEDEAERVARLAFVPRYRRATVRVDSWNELELPDRYVRTIREVFPVSGTTWDATQLAGITIGGGAIASSLYAFPTGSVIVGYEHGLDHVPEHVKAMAIRRMRYHAALAISPAADRQARQILDAESGRTLLFSGTAPYRTGDDEADAVYRAYAPIALVR